MALSTIVKVSSINNLSDARYCAGMGVDLMGFCIDKLHPDYISPLKFKEITGWIAGVKTVAEIENSAIEEVLDHLKDYQFHYLEVSNEKMLNHLSVLAKPFIYKLEINQLLNLPLNENIHYYLVEGKSPLDKDSLKLIKEVSKKHALLYSFGMIKESIKDLLSKTNLKGIELKGGREISPGLKDFDDLSEVLEMLEID